MQNKESPVTSDLVLIGGGHSHLFVLRHFAMNPQPGLRITLVTRDLHTPYSGMLPGFVAGHYDYDAAHIDLLPLARFAGARIIHAEVTAINAERKQITIAGRPSLDYDLLSINTGSRPTSPRLEGQENDQFAVKPVDRFIESWHRLEQRLVEADKDLQLAIIGGGAGAIELALSLQYRASQLARRQASLQLLIVTDRDRLLPGHNNRARQMFADILQQRSIPVFYQHRVTGFRNGFLQGDFEAPVAADAAIWVTHASPADWLIDSGLALDTNGFIAVNPCLQSISHDDVFAAGDVTAVTDYPRPKSGVFAVRQGLPLARNLILKYQQRELRPFRPQAQFLSLISTGDRFAIASRGPWAFKGKWCWWLKDRIDRKFIRRFSELPEMTRVEDDRGEIAPMRCGGCGSKVGSEILEQVLDQIGQKYEISNDSGLEHPDDAALIRVPAGRDLIQSIDHFRSFIDDPYLFGKIATNHALGDLHAMGVDAHSAMVIANVVYGSEDKQSQDLFQLMSGVVETLQQNGTLLIGGHSGEASQMSCGLSVNGFARPEDLILKTGVRPGDVLILTKPLGSGVLFAADMLGKARGDWLDAAIEQMLMSSRDAASCLRQYQASACTDVTGFGLAGHLFEMARESACVIEIYVDRLPLYPGVTSLSRQGIASSLQPQNIRIRHSIKDTENLASHENYPLVFDPQTAGGLVASVAEAQAGECMQKLRQLGYDQAQVIGRAIARTGSERTLSLVIS
ncbi:MAG: selenide, water dikinase SelD [Gammaproteobacteria bacterium]|nr:selenide, water dikinase SelD [Gammaproteobacteria bacterium]